MRNPAWSAGRTRGGCAPPCAPKVRLANRCPPARPQPVCTAHSASVRDTLRQCARSVRSNRTCKRAGATPASNVPRHQPTVSSTVLGSCLNAARKPRKSFCATYTASPVRSEPCELVSARTKCSKYWCILGHSHAQPPAQASQCECRTGPTHEGIANNRGNDAPTRKVV